MPPQSTDRIVIVAPHPDDEVLGVGGFIQQAVAAGARVKIVYLTNGEHNQFNFQRFNHLLHLASSSQDRLAYGEQRRREAVAAAKLLGLDADDLTFLGYPDWATMHLWRDCWQADKGFFYGTTRSDRVPYPDNFSYQHLYKPENVVADLCTILGAFEPTRVLVTDPCDTHPDHRAAANFVRLALLDLEPQGIKPDLDFYLVHYGNWPAPLSYRPDLALKPPVDLAYEGEWMSLPLTSTQKLRDVQATLANTTQVISQRDFLESFTRANEVFLAGAAPTVPLIPANAPVNWDQSPRISALPLLSSKYGFEPNGISSLPALEELKSVHFVAQKDALLTQVELQDRDGKPNSVQLYLFGYRLGADFAKMPKVRLELSADGTLNVTVNSQPIKDHGIILTRTGTRILLRIPLKVLGGSGLDHLFASALSVFDGKASDDTAWHLLRLPSSGKATASSPLASRY